MSVVKVVDPGIYTTIQDIGRYHYQKSGIPVNGAMDAFSCKVANILVGNSEDEACFEATLVGPELQFDSDMYIAVTGADISPNLNGKEIEMWVALKVSRGDILSFGTVKSGCRCYISVSGGLDVPVVMGSRSTYVRGKIGGYEGRILKAGDQINTGQKVGKCAILVKLPENFIPIYKNEITVRVIPGPQDDYFTKEGIKTFISFEYCVTNEADRMGYRLDGPKITHINGADIVSDGITIGSIQIPGNGLPIIMMADRQTTGGYTKIATIITPDIDHVAQLKPGDKIRFKPITIEEAYEVYRQYILKLENISSLALLKYDVVSTKLYKVRVNSKEYEVLVEEIK